MLRVTILRGTGAGTEREVPTDRPIRVGREPSCAVCIPDGRASREHAEVRYEMGTWWVSDLGSTNGTFVNGSRVERAPVGPSDEVQIGDTTFTVATVEDEPVAAPRPGGPTLPASDARAAVATPPASTGAGLPEPIDIDPPRAAVPLAAPADDEPPEPLVLVPMLANVEPLGADTALPPPEDPAAAERLLDALKAGGGSKVYAVIDASRAIELIAAARQRGLEAYTLFSGELAEEVAHVGPCLVAIPEPERFAGSWSDALGSMPGVLLTTDAERDAIARHLRSVFLATDEEGVSYFFRFYDPRVFRAYLPTCTAEERAAFFGPVQGWLVETAEGEPELFPAQA
jgi:hypothetical protein